MTANNVFNETVAYLSQFNFEALSEIAYTEFGVKVIPGTTKEELINECALIETNNFVH